MFLLASYLFLASVLILNNKKVSSSPQYPHNNYNYRHHNQSSINSSFRHHSSSSSSSSSHNNRNNDLNNWTNNKNLHKPYFESEDNLDLDNSIPIILIGNQNQEDEDLSNNNNNPPFNFTFSTPSHSSSSSISSQSNSNELPNFNGDASNNERETDGVPGPKKKKPIKLPVVSRALQVSLLAIIMVLAVLANGSVILNISRDSLKLRMVHFLMIRHVCIADCLGALLVLPTPLIGIFKGEWDFSEDVCSIVSILTASLWTMHLLAVALYRADRVLAVISPTGRYPIFSVRTTKFGLFFVWIIVILGAYGATVIFGPIFQPALALCIPNVPVVFFIVVFSGYCTGLVALTTGYVLAFARRRRKRRKRKEKESDSKDKSNIYAELCDNAPFEPTPTDFISEVDDEEDEEEDEEEEESSQVSQQKQKFGRKGKELNDEQQIAEKYENYGPITKKRALSDQFNNGPLQVFSQSSKSHRRIVSDSGPATQLPPPPPLCTIISSSKFSNDDSVSSSYPHSSTETNLHDYDRLSEEDDDPDKPKLSHSVSLNDNALNEERELTLKKNYIFTHSRSFDLDSRGKSAVGPTKEKRLKIRRRSSSDLENGLKMNGLDKFSYVNDVEEGRERIRGEDNKEFKDLDDERNEIVDVIKEIPAKTKSNPPKEGNHRYHCKLIHPNPLPLPQSQSHPQALSSNINIKSIKPNNSVGVIDEEDLIIPIPSIVQIENNNNNNNEKNNKQKCNNVTKPTWRPTNRTKVKHFRPKGSKATPPARRAIASYAVSVGHLLLYLPAMFVVGLQGASLPPGVALFCGLVVYVEFLVQPIALFLISPRMRKEVLRTIYTLCCCCCLNVADDLNNNNHQDL